MIKQDLIIVAAREGSKGLVAKNKLPFDGVPLYLRTLSQALRISKNVIFSTDDKEMLEGCSDLRNLILIDRPKHLSQANSPKLPVLRHALEFYLREYNLKPDLIIETGIAHGGSILFSASMMEINGTQGEVVAVDIDIRKHNKKLIESHPMFKHITMYEGSSVDQNIVNKIKHHTKDKKCVMVILDSNHTHKHVLDELRIYASLVTPGSYVILPDTFIEYFPKGHYSHNRPWDVGNNPHTAMKAFLKENKNFSIDNEISNKAMISETFDGYLKRHS